MNWAVGKKAIALCDVWILNPDGVKKELIIEHDKIYLIAEIHLACCMLLFDLGKSNSYKYRIVLFTCRNCKKTYEFRYQEMILFHESWFKLLDDEESKMAKAVKQLVQIFYSKKIEEILYPTKPVRNVPLRRGIPAPAEETIENKVILKREMPGLISIFRSGFPKVLTFFILSCHILMRWEVRERLLSFDYKKPARIHRTFNKIFTL